MIQWIALFFSTALMAPPTTYSIPDAGLSLYQNRNSYSLMMTTANVGNYLYGLKANEYNVSQAQVFRVTEQTVILSNGKPVVIASKFLAPLQWLVLSVDVDTGPTAGEQLFSIDTDSNALVIGAIQKATQMNKKYVIYRGTEYIAKDRYDFSFKAK